MRRLYCLRMRLHNTHGMCLLNSTGFVNARSLRKQLVHTNPDQFIITTLKARVCRGWDAWVEDIFVCNSNDTAIAEMPISDVPTPRKRKYTLLAGAIKDLPVDSIVHSWDATGIPQALWGDVPSIEPMIDVLKKLNAEETCNRNWFIPLRCSALWQGRVVSPLLRYQKITKKKLTKKNKKLGFVG